MRFGCKNPMNQKVGLLHIVLVFSFLSLLTLISIWSLSWGDNAYQIVLSEGGLVETVSAMGYFICIGFLLYIAGIASVKHYWYVYLIFLAMGLRELDFDKRFTETGIFKSKFLLANDVGVIEKILGFLVIMLIFYSVYALATRHLRGFFKDLVALKLKSFVVLQVFGLIVVAKTLDGLARKLSSFDVYIDASSNILASRLEEMLELGIPITLMYAIYLYFSKDGQEQTRELET